MSSENNYRFEIELPQWAIEANRSLPKLIPDIEDRMREVIRFSKLNFENETGGPFAAGVFERDTGRVIVIGVNRVVPGNMSSAHAEIVALSLAQQMRGNFDLGSDRSHPLQLVVNARPCAMCFGAIPWSGVVDVVVGASGDDIEKLTGFDEGPIHPNWQQELSRRGITVHESVLEKEACAVLAQFGQSNSQVYNGRLGFEGQ
ncbi:MAG: nucleoside deaminase [Planctomycetota bacterium]